MKKINNNLFKQSVAKFTTGVTIVTINKSGTFLAKTVNSFASLSLKPPLILFSLDKKSSSIQDYKASKHVGINILSKKQSKLSYFFSSSQPQWKIKKYFLSQDNVPLIEDCVANLNCKIIKTLNQGDHIIFFCKVITVKFDESKKPLIYFNSKYI